MMSSSSPAGGGAGGVDAEALSQALQHCIEQCSGSGATGQAYLDCLDACVHQTLCDWGLIDCGG